MPGDVVVWLNEGFEGAPGSITTNIANAVSGQRYRMELVVWNDNKTPDTSIAITVGTDATVQFALPATNPGPRKVAFCFTASSPNPALTLAQGTLYDNDASPVVSNVDVFTQSDLNTCDIPVAPPCNLTGAVTLSQGGWGTRSSNNPLNMAGWFNGKFADGLVIGQPGRSVKFTTSAGMQAFLPQSGTPGALPAGDLSNLSRTLKNTLAGQAAALALNLALTPGMSGAQYQYWPYLGLTAKEILDLANVALGTDSSKADRSSLTNTLGYINSNFEKGSGGTYLACPTSTVGSSGQ